MRKLLVVLSVVVIAFYGVTRISDAPMPKPDKPVKHVWTIEDSKAYARDIMLAWNDHQFDCLVILWTKESNWRSNAYNKVKVMGKNAGGIPQLLGMSPKLHATRQIDRGYSYIIYRYGSPCQALKFHNRRGWY